MGSWPCGDGGRARGPLAGRGPAAGSAPPPADARRCPASGTGSAAAPATAPFLPPDADSGRRLKTSFYCDRPRWRRRRRRRRARGQQKPYRFGGVVALALVVAAHVGARRQGFSSRSSIIGKLLSFRVCFFIIYFPFRYTKMLFFFLIG